jgi:hypothetical protein
MSGYCTFQDRSVTYSLASISLASIRLQESYTRKSLVASTAIHICKMLYNPRFLKAFDQISNTKIPLAQGFLSEPRLTGDSLYIVLDYLHSKHHGRFVSFMLSHMDVDPSLKSFHDVKQGGQPTPIPIPFSSSDNRCYILLVLLLRIHLPHRAFPLSLPLNRTIEVWLVLRYT